MAVGFAAFWGTEAGYSIDQGAGKPRASTNRGTFARGPSRPNNYSSRQSSFVDTPSDPTVTAESVRLTLYSNRPQFCALSGTSLDQSDRTTLDAFPIQLVIGIRRATGAAPFGPGHLAPVCRYAPPFAETGSNLLCESLRTPSARLLHYFKKLEVSTTQGIGDHRIHRPERLRASGAVKKVALEEDLGVCGGTARAGGWSWRRRRAVSLFLVGIR